MRRREIRCNAPHPKVSGWACRAKLNVALPRGYEVRERAREAPDCLHVTCWRCGTLHLVCPVRSAA